MLTLVVAVLAVLVFLGLVFALIRAAVKIFVLAGMVLVPVIVIGLGLIVSVPVSLVSMFANCSVTSSPSFRILKLVTAFSAFSPSPGSTFVTVPSAVASQVNPSGTPVTVKSSCAVFVSAVPS